VQRFIAEQNIQHFKAALARETDEGRRFLLERLLAEEKAKLAKLAPGSTPDPENRD